MSRFFVSGCTVLLVCAAAAQQPSGTSAAPAPGTHMDQSTVQTVGTTPNGAGATVTNPRPSPDAGTALPTLSGNSLVSPPQPVTKTLNGGGLADSTDVADLLAPKPLKPSTLSLIGGTVKSIDQVADHMTLRIYGSGTMHVKFDQRTHFYRDGKETTQLGVKPGDHVYLDTQLFEGKVFAKNVHVQNAGSPADASGQIVSFNRKTGDMLVRDPLAGTTVKFHIGTQTVIRSGDSSAQQSALRPGALVGVKFSPQSRKAGLADEVSIIAEPGTSFTYFGRVTHLDLRSGLLAIENRADSKVYDVHFDPAAMRIPDNLTIGSLVTVVATFEGTAYFAQNLEVNSGPDQAKSTDDDTDLSAAPSTPQGSDLKGKQDKKSKSKQKKADQKDDNDDQL